MSSSLIQQIITIRTNKQQNSVNNKLDTLTSILTTTTISTIPNMKISIRPSMQISLDIKILPFNNKINNLKDY